MWKSLVRKELRENAIIVAAGLIVYLAIAGIAMNLPVMPVLPVYGQGEIPFVGSTFLSLYTFAAVALALALGLQQSLGDSWGNAYLFLLHRPLPRLQVFQNKLLVGMTLYFVLSAIPIVIYMAWAASPGTHASPFEWSMTWPAWRSWMACSLVYLGAFLTGIRPANWFGSRLAPLAMAGLIAVFCGAVPTASIGVLVWLLSCVLFVGLTLSQSNSRDFG